MSGKKIFISYQRGHVNEIKQLVEALEKTGKYEVWYDQKIIHGKWWDDIMAHLREAEVVVLAVSRTYLESTACKLERDYARALNKAILPVTVDQKLNYNNLPREIVELQVKRYFGRTEEFLDLMTALDKEQSPALPDPLPTPPNAPIPPKIGAGRAQPSRYIIAGVIGILVIAAALLILNRPVNPVSDPTDVASAPSATPDLLPTNTIPVRAISKAGAFDITLMYAGLDSFAVRVNAPSNLTDVTLTTSLGASENLMERFPDAATYDSAIPKGVCLIYEREGTNPTLPLSCDSELVQRRTLSPNSVFWFDDSKNLYNNVILRRGDDAPRLCPHDNGGGDCDIQAD